MTDGEADITTILPWSMVSSSSDRRHGDMDDGDDDTHDDDTDDAHDDDETDDDNDHKNDSYCLLYTSPSPRDMRRSRMPSSA